MATGSGQTGTDRASNRDGWVWLDGNRVPTSITNTWNIDQVEGAGAEGGGFFQINSRTVWDYIKTNSTNLVSGYVVEYEQVPEPMAASLMLLGLSGMALRRRR